MISNEQEVQHDNVVTKQITVENGIGVCVVTPPEGLSELSVGSTLGMTVFGSVILDKKLLEAEIHHLVLRLDILKRSAKISTNGYVDR